MENNQILYGDQTAREENFLHDRPRMLMRDLFSVVNLVVFFFVSLPAKTA